MTEQQIDKIKGVFFGQAIGDALGLGTEFLSKKQIADYYPDGLSDYSQIIQDDHRKRWHNGDWTDDTDQFLCICDSVLKSNTFDEKKFAEELFQWFSGTPMGIGMTVYKVVSMPQYSQFPHKAAELVWRLSGQKNASNGAIMRTSILGTYDYQNIENVIQNTENIAKATHWDSRCVGSCVIITSLIAALINNNQRLDAQQLIAIGDHYDSRIKPFVEISVSHDINVLQLDESVSMGYTLKALSAGLWALFNASDFQTGLLKVINEGGDADTNGAVAGSVLGAKFGFEAIPEKYIIGLRNRTLLEDKFEKYIDKLKEKFIY